MRASNRVLEAYRDGVRICPNPVFIIGAPRSGTTVLAQSLAQHSDFWFSDESNFLFHLFGDGHFRRAFLISSGPGNPWLRLQSVDKEELLGSIGLGVNALFFSRSRGRRWIDKTPLYTMIADLLSDMFPTAKFLNLVRDGRRVVHSMMSFLDSPGVRQRGLESGVIGPWSADFAEACKGWSEHVEHALNFAGRVPDRTMTVVNEAVVRDPEKEFDRILNFLHAPIQPEPAEYFGSHRVNSSFGADTGSPPRVDKASLPWGDWDSEKRGVFLREAGATMVRCGFASWAELGTKTTASTTRRLRTVRRNKPT